MCVTIDILLCNGFQKCYKTSIKLIPNCWKVLSGVPETFVTTNWEVAERYATTISNLNHNIKRVVSQMIESCVLTAGEMCCKFWQVVSWLMMSSASMLDNCFRVVSQLVESYIITRGEICQGFWIVVSRVVESCLSNGGELCPFSGEFCL